MDIDTIRGQFRETLVTLMQAHARRCVDLDEFMYDIRSSPVLHQSIDSLFDTYINIIRNIPTAMRAVPPPQLTLDTEQFQERPESQQQ